MTFELPALSDTRYRLWRLRRLIALGTLIPLLVFTLMGLTGLNSADVSPSALIVPAAILLAIIGCHAVLFPNAHEETLTVSVGLAAFAVFAPAFGGSVLGWLAFIVFMFWLLLCGPGKFLTWQTTSKHHHPTMTSRIRVPIDLTEARQWFPLRPDQARGHYRCGPRDAEGVFPVWYTPPEFDIFHGLEIPEPDEFECAKELLDESGEPSESDPSFWAITEEDTPRFQRTRVFELDENGTRETLSIVEHRFEPVNGGCVVTEKDTPDSYPWGLSFTMWLTDFQADGLVYLRDLILKQDTKALKETHRWSLLTLTGRWFAARQFGNVSET